MIGSAEVAEGRVEEATGALVNNEKLRGSGQMDQALGHVKQAAEADMRETEDYARRVVDRAKEEAKKGEC